MAEYNPTTDDMLNELRGFVQARQDAPPVETYDELQQALHGDFNLPGTLANFVRATGEPVMRYRRPATEYIGKLGAMNTITATLMEEGQSNEQVSLMTWRPTMPFMRKGLVETVNIHTEDPTWDTAAVHRPRREWHMPHHSSPKSIAFWSEIGERPLYGPSDEPGRMTAAGMAREASAAARETFNGYLSIAVLLVDKLTHSQPR
jgi:hypothetical protein